MSKARIIHELHDDLGVTLSEAEKAYDIAVEYIHLRSTIGDHPEDYEPSEYVLVKASAEPEPSEDAVPRTVVEYICRKNTVSTNPYEHKCHDKFIQFMDDPEISDFGRWQHSNGFNTALVAVKCDLDKVPSAQPEIIRCRECKHYDGRPCGIVDWYNTADDFCSRAERRTG